ncbi:MAG: DUF938 domain-containing protein [Synechococcus sp.]
MASGDDGRLFFPATQRNQAAIAAVLQEVLPKSGSVLELASGSGEHAVAFQQRFGSLVWQASDPDPLHQHSIDAWRRHCSLLDTMPPALALDVLQRPWFASSEVRHRYEAFVCINLLHISPKRCTEQLFAGAADFATSKAVLVLYGPLMRDGRHTSPSNAAFDASLRQRDPAWGVRDLDWVAACAQSAGWSLQVVQPMPANNFTLVFQMDDSASRTFGD